MKKLCSLLLCLTALTCLRQGAGNAINFDGADDSLKESTTLTIRTIGHTVEVWVKAPALGSAGLAAGERVGVLIGNYDGGVNPNAYNLEIHDDGQMRIFWNHFELDFFMTADLRDNKWPYLAFVRYPPHQPHLHKILA
jgi:hypothetical protein